MMKRAFSIVLAGALALPVAASADVGDDWYAAFRRANGKAAAKVTVRAGLKYGVAGADSVIADKIARHYTRVFKKLRRAFKGSEFQSAGCTTAGRELGYMAGEWRSKDESLATWIRRMPEQFCEGNDLVPPRVWLIKKLDGADDGLPHAVVLFAVGEEENIAGVYHF